MISSRSIFATVTAALTFPGVFVTLLSLLALPVDQDAFAQSTASPPVTVDTDNKSVSVTVSWTPKEIQAGGNTDFTLTFKDAKSGQTLSHVNYDLKVVDPDGNTIKSTDAFHTHSGQDTQALKLDSKGDFTLQIRVIGLGLNQPYDTSRSGTAQASITVVPEFPFSLVALTAGVAIVVIMARWKFSSFTRFLTRKHR